MLISLWRWLRKCIPISSRGKDLPKGRRPSFRLKLEALEDRTLPAPLVDGILPPLPVAAISAHLPPPPPQPIAIPTSGDLGGLQPIDSEPTSTAGSPMPMMVMENSPNSVIDLDPVFSDMSGLHPEDGLRLSLLGNTNPGLVKTDLSGGELTLAYTPAKSGSATITVGATDADGVCARENILVTVLPLPPTDLGVWLPTTATGQKMSIMPSTSRFA